ncbi:MAG: respiratory chain complex I subunit 1 family protein [Myxococcales bacterium]|jgi:formate hydrogenlyase subunit 4
MIETLLHLALLLALPPLSLGVINKVKAFFAGRDGPPLLQAYYDLSKLLRKGAVYSRTTTWLFRAGPLVGLATALLAGLLVPLTAAPAPLAFGGDLVAFAYLLGLGRFFTMAAALDTGSSFEGMGASREAAFSALAEPALFLALAIVCIPAEALSLSEALRALPATRWGAAHPVHFIAAATLFVVLLAECSRIPVDDPNTHLELTMIHEVMVLDHSGPDFAFILYGGAVKLFVFGALLVQLLVPVSTLGLLGGAAAMVGGQLALAALVGLVESVMARLRLVRVPQFLIGASVIATIGVAILLYRGHA